MERRDLGTEFWMSPKLTGWEGGKEGVVIEIEAIRGNVITEARGEIVPVEERTTLLTAIGLSKIKC